MSAAVKQRRHVVSEPTALEEARAGFTDLERWLLSPNALALPLDEVEREQEKRGREVQRRLLQAHMNERGHATVTIIGDAPVIYANVVEIVRGEHDAVIRFGLVTPGEPEARAVAEIVVPAHALGGRLLSFF